MVRPSRSLPIADCGDVQVLLQQGEQLREDGRYTEAAKRLCRAVDFLNRTLGGDDLRIAVALNSLGVVYKYMGLYAESGRAYLRAHRIVERAIKTSAEPELVDFLASLYHNLGGLEHARGRHAKGEPLARRSVALRKSVRKESDPAIAAGEAALAALLDAQGKFDEAESLYRHVLEVFESCYGSVHYEVAVNLNNLAALHQLRGEVELAEPLYLRALAIKEQLLGVRHPDTAITLYNLAVLLQESNRHVEATHYWHRCLAVFRKTLPPHHPKLMAAEEDYAKVCRQRRRTKV